MLATVLVVEDEPMIRFLAVDLAEEAGLRVIEAENADRALALMQEPGEIDIVFTDVRMPGSIDGLELTRIIRDRWPRTKVVIGSGHGSIEMASAVGAERFFSKPYRAEAIISALRELSSDRLH